MMMLVLGGVAYLLAGFLVSSWAWIHDGGPLRCDDASPDWLVIVLLGLIWPVTVLAIAIPNLLGFDRWR